MDNDIEKYGIHEIFKTIQGEGMFMGQPRTFIRFFSCNLKCSFCDTPRNKIIRKINNYQKQILKYPNWVITGGEPMIQQEAMVKIINSNKPDFIEIETNGTREESEVLKNVNSALHYNVSPKESRFQPQGINPEAIFLQQDIGSERIVKFVYCDKKSEEFIFMTIKKYNINPYDVYIMPMTGEGKSIETQSSYVWDFCLANNFNFSSRLHLIGNKKQ